jgi:AraC-like DNA-binding protein
MTVPAALWEGLKRAGVDRAEVARRSNLSLGAIKDDLPVTTQQFFDVWRAIETVSGDPAIGLRIAKGLDGAVMPLPFLAAYHARDFGDALHRVARFKRLCAPEELRLSLNSEEVVVTLDWLHAQGAQAPSALVDATMSSLVELGRRGTGAPIVPRRIELARKPTAKAELEACYGRQVRFRSSTDRLVFHRDDLQRSFGTYNQDLLDVLESELDRRLGQASGDNSVSKQTRWVLRRRLTAGRPDIGSVASELAMSERSLQRKLTEEGVTFQGVLSQTRHELALEYLADPSLTLIEVAYMLGYEDQNSFFRAFRRWEKLTPAAWRLDYALHNPVSRANP